MAWPILVWLVAVAEVFPVVVVAVVTYVPPNPLFHKVVTNVLHGQFTCFVPKTFGIR